MKILKSLLILVSFLLLINLADATVTTGYWQNQQESITINNGEQVYFDAAVYTINPPLDYSIKMYDSSTNLVKTFEEGIDNDGFVSGRYYLTQADYEAGESYSVVITGKDNLDDSSSTILTLQVTSAQTNLPSINIDVPMEGAVVYGSAYDLKWTANDPDQAQNTLDVKIEYRYNGYDWVVLEDLQNNNDGIFTWDTTSLSDADDYEIRITARDDQLNAAQDNVNFIVDNVFSPDVAINNPMQNDVISGIYNIRWTANDPDQAQNTLDVKIEYRYNGYDWVVLEDLQNNNDGIFTWDTTSLSDTDDYEIRVIAADNDGNTGTGYVNNVVLDNVFSPNIVITSPQEDEVIFGVYSIRWTADDQDQNNSTLDVKIEYRDVEPSKKIFKILNLFKINQQQWVTLEDAQDNNDGVFIWNTNLVLDGNYQLRITATDDDGNTGTGDVNLFTIDNQIIGNNNPVITSTPITNAAIGELYNYDVEAFDPDNDILTYSLRISPQDMAIDANTGLISWTPVQEGNYDVVARVNDDNNGYAEQTFTIQVTKEGKIIRIPNKHKIGISNIILKQNGNDLNIFINIINKGNNKEKISLMVTDLDTQKLMQNNFNIGIGDGSWQIATLKDVGKGRHVIRVEAVGGKFKEVKYGVIYI